MESYRLKNIVILILLILNLFLFVLLVHYRFQSERTRQSMLEELSELFTANAISLSEDLELDTTPLASLSVQRNLDTEGAIAAMILGESTTAEHQGGGIYSYTGTYGTIHFRSNLLRDIWLPADRHLFRGLRHLHRHPVSRGVPHLQQHRFFPVPQRWPDLPLRVLRLHCQSRCYTHLPHCGRCPDAVIGLPK